MKRENTLRRLARVTGLHLLDSDLRDQDLGLRHTVCGFHFASEKKDNPSFTRSSRRQGAEFLACIIYKAHE